jgi:hypothetical protein
MRTSIFALGFVAIGLAQCGNRDLFVADERPGSSGEAGETGETGGTGSGRTGGTGGTASAGEGSGGTENTGGSNRGGTGSGAEGGEPSETGGTGGSDRGGTDAGGTDTGGTDTGGVGGDAMRGGAGGNGAQAGSGTAARGGNDGGRAGAGGANDAGRAGSANAGAGGTPTTDCEALAREYRERLAAAQQCSLQLTVEQCTIEMPDDFFCPCKTYVNAMREADVRRLNEILEKRVSCARLCPAIACPDVKRGVCSGPTDIVAAPGRCVGAAM